MIIDTNSISNSEIFDYKDFGIKIHVPYRCYPYNYDFEPKPLHYILPNKKIKKLPQSRHVVSYPIYNENYESVGMTIHENENYNLDKSQKLRFQGKEIPKKLPSNYLPVDTIRFDSDNIMTHQTSKFLSQFIEHLRNISGQWWLGKDNINKNNVTLEGIVSFNGNIGNFTSHSSMIRLLECNNGKPIDLKIWKEAISAVSSGNEINLARSIFLDAIYEEAKTNYRGVVLNIANAIDISVNHFFKKIFETKTPTEISFERDSFVKLYRPHKKVNSTYIPGLISEFMNHIINRDYKTEFPLNYETIRIFWLENRNSVAHGGNINIEKNEINILLNATEHLMNWIDSLQYEK